VSWRDRWNTFLDKWLGPDVAHCHLEHSDLDDDTEELYDVEELGFLLDEAEASTAGQQDVTDAVTREVLEELDKLLAEEGDETR